MNTITPAPIILHDAKPERCPQCKHEEDIKMVCRNCGYEYEDDKELTWKEIIVMWAAILGGLWLLITTGYWLREHDQSLVEIVKGQWQWLKSLRIW